MELIPVGVEHIPTVAGWLAREENYKWLDFGGGRQKLDAVALRVMTQRDHHRLRLYTADGDDRPAGIVGLSDINRRFRTATIWAVLGEKDYGPNGITIPAVGALLEQAFRDLELGAVNAWTVDGNRGGLRILKRLGFNFMGRQRRCHHVDGQARDRLWYDILAEEYPRT